MKIEVSLPDARTDHLIAVVWDASIAVSGHCPTYAEAGAIVRALLTELIHPAFAFVEADLIAFDAAQRAIRDQHPADPSATVGVREGMSAAARSAGFRVEEW